MKQMNFLKQRCGLMTATLALLLSQNAIIAQETIQSARSTQDSLTLDALVAEALKNNPELNFYNSEIAAAKANRKVSGVLANPELSATVGHKTVRGGGLNAEGVAWSVSVMQPFEWPGRIGLRKAIANRDVELAQLGREQFKAALAARVRTLAFGLFAAQEKMNAAREVAERFKALREVLVQRDPAGLTPLLEMRVIEATALNAQRSASEAFLAAQTALMELNQLRGLAPDRPLTIEKPPLRFLDPPDHSRLLALARTNNFELRVRSTELAQQGIHVELAANERFPAIQIGPMISEERAGDRERIIGAGISLPLPLWNRNKGNIEVAEARRIQAQTVWELTWRDIERQVTAAALTYETKWREMSNWRADSIEHFQEAAELADRHYRLGAVPVSTYVELQKQYLEAVHSLLDTKKEALEAAVQLELLTGLTQPLVTTQGADEVKP